MSKKEKACPIRKTSIGGQALMEGIMMRGPEKSAMAVRRPNGEIFFEENPNEKKKRPAICRWPIIRGVFGFVDSMVTGYKYLMKSAEIACEEPENTAASEKTESSVPDTVTEEITAPDTAQTAHSEPESAAPVEESEKKANGIEKKAQKEPQSMFGKGTMAAIMVIATVLGIALAVGLFLWLPSFLYTLLEDHVLPSNLAHNRYLRSVFEGLLKIAVLVAYMALVSLMKDIRRTFMYHGAEHKTIFCYENGLPLTVENVRKQRRFHPRCGTSFLILMLIVSIVIGLFIPAEIPGINDTVYTFIRAALKLLLIPLTMGIGYELLKLAGRHDNLFTRIISAPGMWLQRITVREPTDDMIECAIEAFVAVMPEEDKAALLNEEEQNS
ncbi:MAG: DUF1385 domain-containing protein [Clostridia bacterium]|nr:DUF1385 domain-containing protein [Clostridia bacterium]